MTKSKEIIKTIGELNEYYLPHLMLAGIIVLEIFLSIESVIELKELGVYEEVEVTRVVLAGLVGLDLLVMIVIAWVRDNRAKLEKDNDADHTEAAQDN